MSYFTLKNFISITENLLKRAFTFVEAYTYLLDDEKAIIQRARKSLLFNYQQIWIKRDSELFNVAMGGYDEMEISELLGKYLPYKLSKL